MPHHHHHGVLETLHKPYAKYWVPFLFWLGEKTFDGRVNAGQASHYSRVVRFAVNALTLAIIGLFIKEQGFDDLMENGAEMDPATTAFTAVAMGVNMLAILIGSAANHHKIQQYYDAQITWQELDNAKTKEQKLVPHGFDDDVPWDIKQMQGVRYTHDANGALGSLLSLVILSAYVAREWGPGSCIPLFALGVMFMASRASALLSVLCVPFTTHYRLSVYKNEISEQAIAYCKNSEINTALKKVPLFGKTDLSREEKLLYASCYRACEIYDKSVDFEKIKTVLSKYVESNCLMVETVKNIAGQRRLPFIDALHFIEAEVVAHLSNCLKEESNPDTKDPAALLLSATLRSRGRDIQIEKLKPYIIRDTEKGPWRINKEQVCKDFKTASNPHGSDQFVLGFHTGKLAELACRG